MTGTTMLSAATTHAIDRSSPVPFYHQLKLALQDELKRLDVKPGDRLPGDFELGSLYQVSRTVVRQALAEMENEGLIERVKGRGTFVAHPRTSQNLVQSLTGFFEDTAQRGAAVRSEVRVSKIIPASEPLADDLKVGSGDELVEIERVRFVEDEPWVLTVTYIPHRLVPGLLEEDLTQQSLYGLLREKYQIIPARGHRSVEARAASSRVAKALDIPEGSPVLLLTSLSVDEHGTPVEKFVAYHRGDRSRFEVDLTNADALHASQT